MSAGPPCGSVTAPVPACRADASASCPGITAAICPYVSREAWLRTRPSHHLTSANTCSSTVTSRNTRRHITSTRTARVTHRNTNHRSSNCISAGYRRGSNPLSPQRICIEKASPPVKRDRAPDDLTPVVPRVCQDAQTQADKPWTQWTRSTR